MVVNQPVTILDQLKASDFYFYLTGSRFFGGARTHSDWDFFVEDSADVQSFLVGLDFTPIPSGYKNDPLVTEVFGIATSSEVIHVQLIKPKLLAKKKAAQIILDNCEVLRRPIDKELSAKIWQAVITALGNSK